MDVHLNGYPSAVFLITALLVHRVLFLPLSVNISSQPSTCTPLSPEVTWLVMRCIPDVEMNGWGNWHEFCFRETSVSQLSWNVLVMMRSRFFPWKLWWTRDVLVIRMRSPWKLYVLRSLWVEMERIVKREMRERRNNRRRNYGRRLPDVFLSFFEQTIRNRKSLFPRYFPVKGMSFSLLS